jgi:hypothetical protein
MFWPFPFGSFSKRDPIRAPVGRDGIGLNLSAPGGSVALVPVGAAQGVYKVVAGTATSPLTAESVPVDDVAGRVASADAGR